MRFNSLQLTNQFVRGVYLSTFENRSCLLLVVLNNLLRMFELSILIPLLFLLTDFPMFDIPFPDSPFTRYFAFSICGDLVLFHHCWLESTRFKDSLNPMEKVLTN